MTSPRALCGDAAVVLPGYFWAALLRPAGGLAERLGYSCALSLATVPVVALVLARLAGSGITLWIALASVVLVFGLRGPGPALEGRRTRDGRAHPARSRRDPRPAGPRPAVAVAFVAALVSCCSRGPAPGWLNLLILAAAGPGRRAGRAADRVPERSRPWITDGPAGRGSREPGHESVAGRTGHGGRGRREGAPREARPARAGPREVLPRDRAGGHRGARLRAGDPLRLALHPRARPLLARRDGSSRCSSHGSYRSLPGLPARLPGDQRGALPAVRPAPAGVVPGIAPALLVLTALAAYVLATRLWGWGYGIAAAALTGLVLQGAYGSFADGRYPDLTSAYFLITMGIAALLTLYASPSPRSAALAAVLGASPILYHSVATLYEALILVLAAVTVRCPTCSTCGGAAMPAWCWPGWRG